MLIPDSRLSMATKEEDRTTTCKAIHRWASQSSIRHSKALSIGRRCRLQREEVLTWGCNTRDPVRSRWIAQRLCTRDYPHLLWQCQSRALAPAILATLLTDLVDNSAQVPLTKLLAKRRQKPQLSWTDMQHVPRHPNFGESLRKWQKKLAKLTTLTPSETRAITMDLLPLSTCEQRLPGEKGLAMHAAKGESTRRWMVSGSERLVAPSSVNMSWKVDLWAPSCSQILRPNADVWLLKLTISWDPRKLLALALSVSAKTKQSIQ